MFYGSVCAYLKKKKKHNNISQNKQTIKINSKPLNFQHFLAFQSIRPDEEVDEKIFIHLNSFRSIQCSSLTDWKTFVFLFISWIFIFASFLIYFQRLATSHNDNDRTTSGRAWGSALSHTAMECKSFGSIRIIGTRWGKSIIADFYSTHFI